MYCVWVIFQKILELLTWKRTELKGVVKYFSADFNPNGTSDILGIHKYLTETTWYNNVWVNEKNVYGIIN